MVFDKATKYVSEYLHQNLDVAEKSIAVENINETFTANQCYAGCVVVWGIFKANIFRQNFEQLKNGKINLKIEIGSLNLLSVAPV